MSSFISSGKIDAPLLFLALMYQEVSRAMEIEYDTLTKVPNHLVNLPFGIKKVQKIERLLKGIHLPPKK